MNIKQYKIEGMVIYCIFFNTHICITIITYNFYVSKCVFYSTYM